MSAGQHRQANKHPKPGTRGTRMLSKLGLRVQRREPCACGGAMRGPVIHTGRWCRRT